MSFDRLLTRTAATVSATFSQGDTATDPTPDTATVTVTRADGTVPYTAAPATNAGVGVFTFTLTPTDTARLDLLTIDWTVMFGGFAQTLRTYAEVVGGFLFTLAELRAMKPLDNTATYPLATIVAARTLAEEALEDVCGVAFVPRYSREALSGNGSMSMFLERPRVSAVRSVTLDGVTQTDLTGISMVPTGSLYSTERWELGVANYVIGYEHGYPYPPARVARAALLLAKRWLIDGPFDDRATAMTTEDGTFNLVTPGIRGATFDLPEVNAVVERYGMNVGVA